MSIFDKLDRTILRNIKVTHEQTGNPNPDHLELGSASKFGVIKVYGNTNDPEAFKIKIDNAISILEHANLRMSEVKNKLNGGESPK